MRWHCKSIKYVNYASAQRNAKVCCNFKSVGKVGKSMSENVT